MPGLVSVKMLSRINIPEDNNNQSHQIQPIPERSDLINTKITSPAQRRPPSPSPSSSRAKPSPNRGSGKKKSPEKQSLLDESSLDNPDLGPFLLKLVRDTIAAIYCSLGRFDEAIPVLDRAIKVPEVSRGADHALAAFSGYMQLGDTHSMLGQLDRSIECYNQAWLVNCDIVIRISDGGGGWKVGLSGGGDGGGGGELVVVRG